MALRLLILIVFGVPMLAHAQTEPIGTVPQHVIVDSGTITATVTSADVSDRAGRLLGQVTFATAQPVTFSNTTIAVTNAGTFAVQATQSGTWNIGTVTTLPAITFASPQAVTQSGTWNVGTLTTITNPVAVTGTFWQVTQPISGTVTANAGTGTFTVGDGAGALNVIVDSGSVTANAGTNLNTSALALETTLSTLNGKVTAVNTGATVISTFPDNEPINVAQIAGTAVSVNTGVRDAGTQRVTIATNDVVPVSQSGTWTANPSTAYGKTILQLAINQGAAGTTQIAAASASNKHKIVSATLTMSAAGTIKFTDGAGDLTGALDVSATGGFVIPASILPSLETSTTNTALSIVTTVGAARGWVRYITEP